MIEEVMIQLRAEAGERQLPPVHTGVVQNSGGAIGLDDAVAAVMILQRVNFN